jgi:hypothetical protein
VNPICNGTKIIKYATPLIQLHSAFRGLTWHACHAVILEARAAPRTNGCRCVCGWGCSVTPTTTAGAPTMTPANQEALAVTGRMRMSYSESYGSDTNAMADSDPVSCVLFFLHARRAPGLFSVER